MPQSAAGWLTIQPDTLTISFTPHPRFSTHPMPERLPVSIGSNLKKNVRIHQSKKRRTSPQMLPTRLVLNSNGQWEAGPFIAILTSTSTNPFGGNRSNFADIIHMGRRIGVTVYVMTADGFDPKASTVQGWLLKNTNTGRRWIKSILPRPHVVYNRIPTRKAERRQIEQSTLYALASSRDTHLFNPGFFDKWNLHQCIQNSPELRSLLPETYRWGEIDKFRQLLSKHDTLYLKPAHGKAGNGMARTRVKEKGYEIVFQTLKKRLVYQAPDWKLLTLKLHQLTQGREYIVQQGIPLAQYQGRPFDLRLLLQRNEHGEWAKTGLGVRVAGSAAISTHVPMGGTIADAEIVLSKLFESNSPAIIANIEKTGIEIARSIEIHQQTTLGEMSMDIGIEKSGRLWFFEANAKPMKFDEPNIRELSLRRLLQYCIFLSGFQLPLQKEANICSLRR
ncbi:YheC/D like ATP-grasp [Marininema mesophilum]|uniref:YheC/D like ATP-grasp n=1 Tax=Marininema mesophilum TaxID=1048340 RepID=A0A1H2XY56_9BACL|nr:YheC/YheD family protein [Marininema mesophilum]SDW97761.1 YheC/D like ATP-grasp [Marininema mesophilum]